MSDNNVDLPTVFAYRCLAFAGERRGVSFILLAADMDSLKTLFDVILSESSLPFQPAKTANVVLLNGKHLAPANVDTNTPQRDIHNNR